MPTLCTPCINCKPCPWGFGNGKPGQGSQAAKKPCFEFPDSTGAMRSHICSQLSGLKKKDEKAAEIARFLTDAYYHKAAVEVCRQMPEFAEALQLARRKIQAAMEKYGGKSADSTVALCFRLNELLSFRQCEPFANSAIQ